MSMDVVLDSNAYRSDYRMESARFIALYDHLRKSDGRIVLFSLVKQEVVAGYSRDFQEKISDRWDKMLPFVVDRQALSRPDITRQLETLDQKLRHPATVKVSLVEDFGGVDIAEVVRRGVNRVPPANKFSPIHHATTRC
jgi:hypothetical protein